MTSMIPISTSTTVPLHLLVADTAFDPRKSGRKSGIGELEASIEARGLQTSLKVRQLQNGKYEVIGGRRRLRALNNLQKAKKIPRDWPVPVIVGGEATDEEAHESSVAENVVRQQLEPIDEFEAFARLAETNSIEEIAARFGVSEKLVRQRMALGSLHPDIRAALRKGKIGLAHAQAFAASADQAAQLEVFKQTKRFDEWTSASIKRLLEKDKVDVKSGVVSFVGLDAYREAGGAVEESLFANESFITDSGLVNRLAQEKLQAECDRLIADGWSFARIPDDDFYRAETIDFDEFANEDEKAQLAADTRYFKQNEVRNAIAERLMNDAEVKSRYGCIVTYNGRGNLDITHFCLNNDDADPDSGSDEEEGAEVEHRPIKSEINRPPSRVSKLESQRLSETLTAALSGALADSFHVSCAAAIAAIECGFNSPVRIVPSKPRRFDEDEDSEWRYVFMQCVRLDQDALLRRLARAISSQVNVSDNERMLRGIERASVNALIGAVRPDSFRGAMAHAFNARDYFMRGTSKMAIEALDDMGVPLPGNRSKANLIEKATECAIEQGYLPPELRTVHYTGPTGAETEAEAA